MASSLTSTSLQVNGTQTISAITSTGLIMLDTRIPTTYAIRAFIEPEFGGVKNIILDSFTINNYTNYLNFI